ncbi:MAG: hypothetical protein ACLQVD_12580 [Capsulimonadaceae bacterium]
MKTRRRVRLPWLQSGRGFRVLLGGVVALSTVGFIHFGSIATFRQEHLPPGYEHPWDLYADLCLTVALLAGAAIPLSLREPRGPNFQRVASLPRWRIARPDHHPDPGPRAKLRRPPRPRRHRGKYR